MHTSVCWHTALLEDISIIVMAQVDEASLAPAIPHSARHHSNMQQKKPFTDQISLSRLEVI